MDTERREFLKRVFQIGGLAALYSLGAVESAESIGLLAGTTTGPTGSWATWDETDESGWGDSANVFITLFENTSAGGNETGQGGGLSGADLVLTQSGNVAGATGSPPTRAFVTDDRFQGTQIAFNLITGNEWSFVLKINSLALAHAGNSDYLLSYVTDWNIFLLQTGEIQFGGVAGFGKTTDSPATNVDLWIVMARPSSGNTWGGFATSKPNVKADVESTKLVDFGSATSPSTSGQRYIGAYSDGTQAMECSVYYLLMSDKYLF